MFDFPSFCRRWALAYKPFHIRGKNTKEFCCLYHDNLDARGEIVKKLTAVQENGLFMSVITAIDADYIALSEKASRPNFVGLRRNVIFWVQAHTQKQTPQGSMVRTSLPASEDETLAAMAKQQGAEVAQDFVAFLDFCTDPKRGAVKGFDIDWLSDEGAPSFNTLPVWNNGWFGCALGFTQIIPREKCVVEEKYDPTLITTLFPELKQHPTYL